MYNYNYSNYYYTPTHIDSSLKRKSDPVSALTPSIPVEPQKKQKTTKSTISTTTLNHNFSYSPENAVYPNYWGYMSTCSECKSYACSSTYQAQYSYPSSYYPSSGMAASVPSYPEQPAIPPIHPSTTSLAPSLSLTTQIEVKSSQPTQVKTSEPTLVKVEKVAKKVKIKVKRSKSLANKIPSIATATLPMSSASPSPSSNSSSPSNLSLSPMNLQPSPSPSPSGVPLSWFESMDDFKQTARKLQTIPSYKERLEKLFNENCEFDKEKYSFWINIGTKKAPLDFKVVIDPKASFESLAFAKSNFPPAKEFCKISVFETSIDPSTGEKNLKCLTRPIMEIVSSEKFGELEWIMRGHQIRGGTTAALYRALAPLLSDTMYLWDASKTELALSEKTKVQIWFKSLSIGDPEGTTLYGRWCGMEPLDTGDKPWKKLPHGNQKEVTEVTQNRKLYKLSMSKVQKMTLKEVKSIYDKYPATPLERKKIEKIPFAALFETAFGRKFSPKKDAKLTLQELAAALNTKETNNYPKNNALASLHAVMFMHKFPLSDQDKEYWDHIERLAFTQIMSISREEAIKFNEKSSA